ncbi:type III pantothenate kinase [Flammeovirgaceae bacterium SG7u.111]|nr:type III pantothenate kinase [Flammeovirgaceae bacterium SG7u.132]WPO36176.1 type III pantothenate kinase [Flammeovirgaceae bacterium SG7u.111]
MLLVADIGNTNIVFGIYDNEKWAHVWRFETHPVQQSGRYELFLRNSFLENGLKTSQLTASAISSVVPSINKNLKYALESLLGVEPLMVGPKTYKGLTISINNPNEIGADLVCNAVAAHQYCKDQTEFDYCIIVDFGTALTFTPLTKKGELLGVAIAPGIRTAMKALSSNTAKLPEIPLEVPESVLGKNTIHALQAGILEGYVGLVRHMLDKIKQEVGQPCMVIATGGLSSVLDDLQPEFHKIDPMLTLDGLRIICEQNL